MFADLRNIQNNKDGIYMVGISGIPFKLLADGSYYFYGTKVRHEYDIKIMILEQLGMSGVLTYGNPNNLTFCDLGEVVLNHNHTWSFNWMNISIAFKGDFVKEFEMAVLRDARFYTSWSEVEKNCNVLVVHGTLRSFQMFANSLAKRSDKQNEGIELLRSLLTKIIPTAEE